MMSDLQIALVFATAIVIAFVVTYLKIHKNFKLARSAEFSVMSKFTNLMQYGSIHDRIDVLQKLVDILGSTAARNYFKAIAENDFKSYSTNMILILDQAETINHIFPIEKEIKTFHKLVKNKGYYFMFKILCRQDITDNDRLAAYNHYSLMLRHMKEFVSNDVLEGEVDAEFN